MYEPKGTIIDMTDKQLKSLSKIQMLDILRQQEREIEKLTAEIDKPRSDTESTALLSGIMQAAQAAADSYVKSMVVAENEKIEGIAKLESSTRRRAEEAERRTEEAMGIVKKMIDDMYNIFSWQIDLIKSMQNEFFEKLKTTNLKELIPAPAIPQNAELGTAEAQTARLNAAETQTSGPVTVVAQTAGLRAAEVQTAGLRAAEVQTAGLSATDAQTAGPRAAEVQTAGLRAAEAQTAGPRAAEAQTAGPRAAEAQKYHGYGINNQATGITKDYVPGIIDQVTESTRELESWIRGQESARDRLSETGAPVTGAPKERSAESAPNPNLESRVPYTPAAETASTSDPEFHVPYTPVAETESVPDPEFHVSNIPPSQQPIILPAQL